MLRLFCGFSAHGTKNLPKKGGFIIASNHVSYLDPIVVSMGTWRHLNFMARESLFSNAFFGTVIASAGAFPLKRNSADLGALREGIKRVKQGNGLLLFPEGERAIDPNEVRKPLAGVGFLAAKAGAPVFPAYIDGTDKILPKGAKFPRRHRVHLYFGKPVPLHPGLDHQEAADLVMSHIRQLRDVSVSKRP